MGSVFVEKNKGDWQVQDLGNELNVHSYDEVWKVCLIKIRIRILTNKNNILFVMSKVCSSLHTVSVCLCIEDLVYSDVADFIVFFLYCF